MAREVSAVLNPDRRRERIEPAFVDSLGHQCADPDHIEADVTNTPRFQRTGTDDLARIDRYWNVIVGH